jgi:hypothetical protein
MYMRPSGRKRMSPPLWLASASGMLRTVRAVVGSARFGFVALRRYSTTLLFAVPFSE